MGLLLPKILVPGRLIDSLRSRDESKRLKTLAVVYFITLRSVSKASREEKFLDLWAHTPPLLCGFFQKGKPDLQGFALLGKQREGLLVWISLFTAEILFEVPLFSKKSKLETGLIFLPLGFPPCMRSPESQLLFWILQWQLLYFKKCISRCWESENCFCELSDSCAQHTCCGIFKKKLMFCMDPFKKPYNSWLISIANCKTDLHIPVVTILSYFLMHLVEDKRPYGNYILSGNTYMSGSRRADSP